MPASSEVAVGGADEPRAETEPPQRLSLDVVHQSGDWGAFGDVEGAVRAAGEAVANHPGLDLEAATACVALACDDSVRALNRTYRGLDRPTNVLSFPAPAVNVGQGRHLGDVVLASQTVLAESAAAGISPTHHLQHLVVHGLLHLLGYDHERDEQAAEMERLEVAILRRIGVADPYREDAI
jgi:probable rRNA maturation factor